MVEEARHFGALWAELLKTTGYWLPLCRTRGSMPTIAAALWNAGVRRPFFWKAARIPWWVTSSSKPINWHQRRPMRVRLTTLSRGFPLTDKRSFRSTLLAARAPRTCWMWRRQCAKPPPSRRRAADSTTAAAWRTQPAYACSPALKCMYMGRAMECTAYSRKADPARS